MAAVRRYNKWAGNPNGTPEDPEKCVAEVSDEGYGGFLLRQCSNKRGKGPDGLLCGIHARQHARRPNSLWIPENDSTDKENQ